MSVSGKMTAKKWLAWVPFLIFLVWTLLPLLWSFSSTFKTPLEIYQRPPSFLPNAFLVDSYRAVFQFPNFFTYLMNSVLLAIGSTLMAIAVSSLAGYAFARYAFRFRHVLLMIVLVPRILPRAALVVPLYQLFARIGILDTYAVLLISYTATAVPLATWILAGFFKGIPESLEESARLDGAGLIAILFRIVLPVALPGLITVIVVSAVQSWNEFPFVLAFTNSPRLRTLPYQLYLLRDTLGIEDWPLINAFSIVTIVPIVTVYLVFQNRVINGLVGGSTKG